MAKRAPPRPTEAEMAILSVLWERGPSTVREVHEALKRERPVRYTTTLKQLQIMTERGLVRRDESVWAHIYHPALPERETLRQLTRHLLEQAFGGSAQKLVMHALEAKSLSHEEVDKIRGLLDKFERGK